MRGQRPPEDGENCQAKTPPDKSRINFSFARFLRAIFPAPMARTRVGAGARAARGGAARHPRGARRSRFHERKLEKRRWPIISFSFKPFTRAMVLPIVSNQRPPCGGAARRAPRRRRANRTEPNQTKPNRIRLSRPSRLTERRWSHSARARVRGCSDVAPSTPRAAAAPRAASRHTTPRHATPRRAAPRRMDGNENEANRIKLKPTASV